VSESATRILAGRYELGEALGHGGMAEVFEGRDVRLGRRVAIKVLRADLARDPSFLSRFQREAQSAASLNHPNIVAVYDTGEEQVEGSPVGVPYIVMEYVDGITLRQLMQSGRRVLPERAMEIMAGALAALDYSHRHGIVHRDIKPGNIMLTRTGEVKVMDFGIARALADQGQTMTQTSAVLGTASYLSPEQARGELVDARSDIYSAGCVFYELLVGRAPFTGESPVAIAYQHVSERPTPPTQIDASLPSTIDNIVLTSLAKKPEDRYETAAEFRSDLERVLAGAAATAVAPMIPMPSAAVGAVADEGGLDNTRLLTALEGFQEEEARERRSPWPWIALAIAVVAVAAGMFLLGRSLFATDSTGDIRVPNLIGLTVAEAENELADLGLQLGRQQPQASNTVPVGRIIEQDPGEGRELSRGESVDIVVSSGADTAIVPELIDLISAEDARAKLREVGLELGRVREVPSTEPVGQVVGQSPEPGLALSVGDRVDIEVSNGGVLVPNVIGSSEARARAILTNAGFVVVVERQVDNVAPPGTVIAQAPEPGQQGRIGATVSIVVAEAPSSPPNNGQGNGNNGGNNDDD
jgi:eukaryotic-like serine/threonine-protein kinase